MTSFYSGEELKKIGFRELGDGGDYSKVYISRNTSIYNPEKISIGNHVRIDDFCILSGKIEIKNYVHIAAYTSLFGGDVGIYMNDFSGISSHSSVYAVSDDYSGNVLTNPMVPYEYKNVVEKEVILGKHVIVGSHSVILPGCKLNDGVAVGAMSLVNKSLDRWKIYAGVPCKEMKNRSQRLLEFEKKMCVASECGNDY